MFITFEGIEGAGKSTLVSGVRAWFEAKGHTALVTREPGGCAFGALLRSVLLDANNTGLTPEAELFLYLADRAQHVVTVIRPALKRGEVVLCDRYVDSTIAYQGYGRGFDPLWLLDLNRKAVQDTFPDLTFLIDIDPEMGLSRAMARNARENTTLSEGRFEAENVSFHMRVRQGFLALADMFPARFRIVDGARSVEKVLEQALAVLDAEYARHI